MTMQKIPLRATGTCTGTGTGVLRVPVVILDLLVLVLVPVRYLLYRYLNKYEYRYLQYVLSYTVYTYRDLHQKAILANLNILEKIYKISIQINICKKINLTKEIYTFIVVDPKIGVVHNYMYFCHNQNGIKTSLMFSNLCLYLVLVTQNNLIPPLIILCRALHKDRIRWPRLRKPVGVSWCRLTSRYPPSANIFSCLSK
jgi:hypothetical protein